jgi:thiamine-phosphate pyrophosphorylase
MLIVFSAENWFPGEIMQVTQLFEAGLERFHLRKPGATATEMQEFLEQIPEAFRARVTLHQHHGLAIPCGVGGLHFPQKDWNAVTLNSIQSSPALMMCSTGVHSLDMLKVRQADLDYLFLSPIFPSISKSGYASAESLSIAGDPEIQAEKVVALGGIDLARLESCRENGFQHIALLGAIWQSAAPIATFVEIQEKWLKSNPIA